MGGCVGALALVWGHGAGGGLEIRCSKVLDKVALVFSAVRLKIQRPSASPCLRRPLPPPALLSIRGALCARKTRSLNPTFSFLTDRAVPAAPCWPSASRAPPRVPFLQFASLETR